MGSALATKHLARMTSGLHCVLMLVTMIPHHAHGKDYEIVVDALLSGVRVYSTFNGAQIGPTLSSSFDDAFLDQPLWGVVVDELVKIARRDLDREVQYE